MGKNAIGFGPLKGPDQVGGQMFGSGLVLAYTTNHAVVTIADTVITTTMQLLVSTTAVSNGICGFNLQGTASADMNLRVDVMHGSTVAASFVTRLRAGPNMVSGPFLLINIPAETANWSLRIHADGGTWTMPAELSSWWIESGSIEGGLVADDPSSLVNETVSQTPVTVTDTVTEATQNPVNPVIGETVSQTPVAITDTAVTLTLASTAPVAANGDDGYYSATLFNNGGVTMSVGKSGTEPRTAFARFTLPFDLAGQNLTQALLDITPDANQVTPVQVRVELALTGSTTAPTSQSDGDSRTKTTSHVDTSLAATVGAVLTIDITAMMLEIKALGAPFTSALVFIEDNGSPSDTQLVLRTRENAASTPPKLRFYIGGT